MKLFQKKVEDFTCLECGTRVLGNGYTNHCPHCLASRHVDNNPGDRAATCGGMMKPKTVEQKGSGYVVTHECKTCGHIKRNKISEKDNFNKVIEVSKNLADKR